MNKHITPKTSVIVIALEQDKKFLMSCEVCQTLVERDNTCDHGKNGYCALFRLQAANDMLELKLKSK